MSAVFKNSRPHFVIECEGGKSLGNCYSATYFKITSTRKLSQKELDNLWRAGFLGYGQEFSVKSKCDGSEEPAGHDRVVWIEEDTGERAVNPYTQNLYDDHLYPYYVYKTEARCDSGD